MNSSYLLKIFSDDDLEEIRAENTAKLLNKMYILNKFLYFVHFIYDKVNRSLTFVKIITILSN